MDLPPAVAMATAIVSVMTGIPARRDVAHDRRNHACAAACGRSPVSRRSCSRPLRGGIKTVLIPEENAKDLMEISESNQERP